MTDLLYNYLMKLPKHHLVCLMWNALDEMESWNGQSKTSAITRALGGEVDQETGRRFRLPSIKQAKEMSDTTIFE